MRSTSGCSTSAPTTRAWSPACCGSIVGAGATCPTTLDQVASTLRERHAAAREVRALTAQARLSGTILGVLPVGFFAFLWITSRNEIEGAFRSPAGVGAIGLGLVLEGLAFLWIRRSAGGSMSVLAVVAAVAAAVLLVASVRAFLIGGLRHRLPSMPASSAEHDLRKRSAPSVDLDRGRMPRGAAGGRVAVPDPAAGARCLPGWLSPPPSPRSAKGSPPGPRGRRRDPATARPPGGGIVRRTRRSTRAPSRRRRSAWPALRRGTQDDRSRRTRRAMAGGAPRHERSSGPARPASHRVRPHSHRDAWIRRSKQRPRNSPPPSGRRGERRSPSALARLR